MRPFGNADLSRTSADLARALHRKLGHQRARGHVDGRTAGPQGTAVVPDNAPEAKLAGLRSLGADTVILPYAKWRSVIETGRYDRLDGLYIDVVRDPAALAGDATIGAEIGRAHIHIGVVMRFR